MPLPEEASVSRSCPHLGAHDSRHTRNSVCTHHRGHRVSEIVLRIAIAASLSSTFPATGTRTGSLR